MTRQEQDTITIEDSTLRKGFTRIPNGVLRREGLSPGAKLAYMGLLSYAWQEGSCFPGQALLAEDLGIGQRTVVRYLKELQAVGLLIVKRRGLGKTNLYILPKDELDGEVQAGSEEHKPRARSPRAGSANLARQEVPEDADLEVPDWQREEDAEEEDTDLSKSRKVAPRKDRPRARQQEPSTSSISGASAESAKRQFEQVGDALKSRIPSRSSASGEDAASDRDIVMAYMRSLALELHDQAPLRSTVTRLLRLYERSRVGSIQAFVDVLYQARAITREHASSIRAGEPGARRVMPYFIAVVEDLVGLREQDGRSNGNRRR